MILVVINSQKGWWNSLRKKVPARSILGWQQVKGSKNARPENGSKCTEKKK